MADHELLTGTESVENIVLVGSSRNRNTLGKILTFKSKTQAKGVTMKRCPGFFTRVPRLVCGGRKILFNNRTTDVNENAKQHNQLLAHAAANEGKQTGRSTLSSYQMQRRIEEEYDERLREQERAAIEFKNLAVAELEVLQKLRMEREKNKQMITMMEENDEKLKATETKNLAEEELALVRGSLRIEQEKNKQMLAVAEENEKLREQEKAIASDELAKAELAVIAAKREKIQIHEEKLQMEEEKNKLMIALAEENDERLKEQVESKKLAEAELAMMHEKLRREQEKNKQLIVLAVLIQIFTRITSG